MGQNVISLLEIEWTEQWPSPVPLSLHISNLALDEHTLDIADPPTHLDQRNAAIEFFEERQEVGAASLTGHLPVADDARFNG